jgi:hypothetical protein
MFRAIFSLIVRSICTVLRLRSKHVEQPRNNKLSNTAASCWSFSYISWCRETYQVHCTCTALNNMWNMHAYKCVRLHACAHARTHTQTSVAKLKTLCHEHKMCLLNFIPWTISDCHSNEYYPSICLDAAPLSVCVCVRACACVERGTSTVYKPAASTFFKTSRTIQHHTSEDQVLSVILVTLTRRTGVTPKVTVPIIKVLPHLCTRQLGA